MADNIISVRLQTIKYGAWDNLEVAIDINNPDGKTLYLTTPTAELILNYEPNNLRKKITSKSFKSLLDNGCNIGKFSGLIVNKKNVGTNKVSLISLTDFLKIAIWESGVNHNIVITRILAAGFEDSIKSIAYEQLGYGLTLDERQADLKARLKGIGTRKDETDAVKWYIDNNEVTDNYRKFIYSNISNAVNKSVFCKTAKQLCEERGCSPNKLRDTHNEKDLKLIENIERHAGRLILKFNTEPLQAIKEAIEFYG